MALDKKPDDLTWAHTVELTEDEREKQAGIERRRKAKAAALVWELEDPEDKSDDAWRLLLLQHVPYQLLDDAQRTKLIEQVSALEAEILKYKGEKAEKGDSSEATVGERAFLAFTKYKFSDKGFDQDMTDETAPDGNVWSGVRTRLLVADAEGQRLAIKQARLMEQAYFSLQLNRYANAPVNRGLMNLFRAWSSAFMLDSLIRDHWRVFNNGFLEFYLNYIRGLPPIDDHPIPHPWDRHVKHEETEPEFSVDPKWQLKVLSVEKKGFAPDTQPEEKRPQKKRGRGVYLDSGIIEASVDDEAESETPEQLAKPKTDSANPKP